jgi:hypothetical protein
MPLSDEPLVETLMSAYHFLHWTVGDPVSAAGLAKLPASIGVAQKRDDRVCNVLRTPWDGDAASRRRNLVGERRYVAHDDGDTSAPSLENDDRARLVQRRESEHVGSADPVPHRWIVDWAGVDDRGLSNRADRPAWADEREGRVSDLGSDDRRGRVHDVRTLVVTPSSCEDDKRSSDPKASARTFPPARSEILARRGDHLDPLGAHAELHVDVTVRVAHGDDGIGATVETAVYRAVSVLARMRGTCANDRRPEEATGAERDVTRHVCRERVDDVWGSGKLACERPSGDRAIEESGGYSGASVPVSPHNRERDVSSGNCEQPASWIEALPKKMEAVSIGGLLRQACPSWEPIRDCNRCRVVFAETRGQLDDDLLHTSGLGWQAVDDKQDVQRARPRAWTLEAYPSVRARAPLPIEGAQQRE